MFVIGTAGHIDHGKSSMILRLTGIDPDRLPEEKARGMTIDIGFAYYDTDDGKRIGIIDVPGHERFVRNMIAGAGGIDAVILVIAADDGWMPQSREHLQITELLGIKYGFVALTKIDMVEPSWLDLVEDDIRDKIKDTFLAKAPIIRLSSTTGDGFDRLKEEINTLSQMVVEREDIGKPRLYVDRSFVLAGMGGVVAGTLRGGTLKVGDDIAVHPARKNGRVRSIQSHNQQVDLTSPGQRTSISLTGIDKEYLSRGNVIMTPELLDDYKDDIVLAMDVTVLPESPIVLDNRRRLLIILGTTEVEGEIRLLDKPIPQGNHGIIFFKPFDPLFSFIGDRAVFRLPTPQVTIGGGTVLDIVNRFPRKKDKPSFAYLSERINLTAETLISSEFKKNTFVNAGRDFLRCNYSRNVIVEEINKLKNTSQLDEYEGAYYQPDSLQAQFDSISDGIKTYLSDNPHLDGVSIDIVAAQTGQTVKNIETILELMCHKNKLSKKGNRYDLPKREITVKGTVKQAADEINNKLIKNRFTPPLLKELIGDNKINREAFDYLLVTGQVVKIGNTLAFSKLAWNEILSLIRTTLNNGEILSVASLRAKMDSSRKFALPILEETDRLKITRREGDARIKGANFEKE